MTRAFYGMPKPNKKKEKVKKNLYDNSVRYTSDYPRDIVTRRMPMTAVDIVGTPGS